jgi:hypothetical protein
MRWASLVVGLLLMSGTTLSALADDNCPPQECRECSKCKWKLFKHRCKDDCNRCYGSSGCRHCNGRGCRHCSGCCGCYKAVDPSYCDPRDLRLYSAQGYDTPVAVPLAPVVKYTYNYGWGVPSSRLIRVGAKYNQWYPDVPYTQTAGRLPGGVYPMVYQPTDTTQLGFYQMHTPRWLPWGSW